MTDVFTRAIPVVEPTVTGVHLMWVGPPEFLFAPGGWRIERRVSAGPLHVPSICDVVTESTLKGAEELRLNLGTMIVASGRFPEPDSGPCLVCRLELSPAAGGIHGSATGFRAFVYGLRNGKATAVAGPLVGAFDLGAAPIDTLVFYLAPVPGAAASSLRICRYRYEADDWSHATLLATRQLPVAELMPSLTSPDAEFAEAAQRLLPGESIDQARFHDFTNLIRRVALVPPSQPTQSTLLVRAVEEDEFDELCLLDPLRMVYSSPVWRRALGFSYFDDDPALVVNQQYDYRITGMFRGDTPSALYGFHTIPTGTALPREFYLQDCHVRLPAPAVVRRAPGVPQTGLLAVTRRGIQLEPQPDIPWLDGMLDQYSLVIDLPAPATSVGLELESGHQLTIEGGVAWGPFTPAAPVPAGPSPAITFPQPVTQLRLSGKGFLFAIRSPASPTSGGLMAVPVVISPVHLVNTPRPAPPLSARAQNIQASVQLTTSGLSVPPRHRLGIDVGWEPAPMNGQTIWPLQEPAPPPLEVTSFQIERRTEPAGSWEPVIGGDNLVLGSRDEAHPDTTIRPCADLMSVYPESRGPRGQQTAFTYRDVFMTGPEGEQAPQPPAPGTMLRYRVRAVDATGRASATWTETDPVRLEKHEPPPLPAGPDERTADELPDAAPSGVQAAVLVRGSQGMTAEETSLLGTSDNAIVLRWGWHDRQRTLDPFARQFRVYLAPPLDEIAGTITAATADPVRPGVFHAALTLVRPAGADAAKGQYLDAGYPFFVETHTGGTDVQVTLRTTLALPEGGFHAPALGAVTLRLKYSSQLTRAAGWRERLQPTPGQSFVPITPAEQYEIVVRDRLLLTDDHPRDAVWIGVTAADDQPYVADTFAGSTPGGPLPGNESSVAAVLCQGKRLARPDYTPPPPAGAVHRVVAPEPVNGPVVFHLDLAPYLAGAGLPGGGLVQPERVHSGDLLAAFEVQHGDLFARAVNARSNEASQPVAIPNPADRAAIVAAIEGGDFESLDDRFLVLLAHLHPFRDRLFQPVSEIPGAALDFDESLPSVAARYVYRVRKSSAAGSLSVDGAIPAVVVRVPSTAPGPMPVKDARRPADPEASLRFVVPENRRLTHLLIFQAEITEQDASTAGELLRVPNRPDLFPAGNVRMRLATGTVLAPSVIPLSTLEHDAQGWRALVEVEPGPTGAVRAWVATLTADGIPSDLSGPWRIPFTPVPLAAPILSASAVANGLRFQWTWPAAARTPVTLERSADGVAWARISAPIGTAHDTFTVPSAGAPGHYRLNARTGSGQPVLSNVVVI